MDGGTLRKVVDGRRFIGYTQKDLFWLNFVAKQCKRDGTRMIY
jgi:hypothetical protein